jgi:peptide/nickel transport system substrate-binding protein
MKRAITKIQIAIIVAIIAILAIIGIVAFTYFYKPTQPTTIATTTPKTIVTTTPLEKIAVQCMISDVVIFADPSESFSNEIVVLNNVYEKLVHYITAEDKFVPQLATDWSVSEDGLIWTFTLRKGVKFHTGNKFDANAVKYSLERTKNLGAGPAFLLTPIKEIKVIEEYKVQIILEHPAPLLSILASPYGAFIMDPKVTEEKGKDWFYEGNDAGTGPYKWVEWNKAENYVVLEKFDEYWGGWNKPHFTKIIIKGIEDPTTRRYKLEAGEVDIVEALPYEHIEALKNNPNIKISVTHSFQNLFFFFNTERYPLNITKVRQALSYAFPYEEVIRTVLHGYGVQAKGAIPHGMWAFDDRLFQYKYDIAKAKELLTEAGFPNGFDRTLELTYLAGNEDERRAAELYKAELAKLGIDLVIRSMPWDEQWAKAKGPAEQRQDIFVMYWWPDVCGDPYTYLVNQFHSEEVPYFGMAYWKNSTFDSLIDEAWSTSGLDKAKAKELYFKAQQILVHEAPAIFVYVQDYVRAMRSDLMGYIDDPSYPHIVFWYNCYKKE